MDASREVRVFLCELFFLGFAEVTASVNYKLSCDQTEPDKVYLPTKKQMISLISEVRRVLRSAKKQASPSSYSEGNLQEATTLQSSDEVSSPTSETKIDPDTNKTRHNQK
ncbi:hypothetical protein WMY93_025662 [Mugilogobius chulae]|uniref:Uncharacterized protein n=1 Tax=Mugilogobius chulae TaxID=88201 RepID=A0AAW0MZZ8_9GOBI